MNETSAAHIFLSYARADGQAAVDTLRKHLANPALTANQPLAVWQDLTSMRSGQWREQIRSAIKYGSHLLLVLSVTNSIRAHLAELGIVAPVGRRGADAPIALVGTGEDERIPGLMRSCLMTFLLAYSSAAPEWNTPASPVPWKRRGRRPPPACGRIGEGYEFRLRRRSLRLRRGHSSFVGSNFSP